MTLGIWTNGEIESVLRGLYRASLNRCSEYGAALEDVAASFGVRSPVLVDQGIERTACHATFVEGSIGEGV